MILDLGGGSRCYCIAAVQKYPHLKAIVFDLEPVCRVAKEFIAQWGIAEVFYGSEGRSHSEEDVKGYLEEAGFVDVQINPFIPGSLSRITGRKP
jgi:hypothetical protein